MHTTVVLYYWSLQIKSPQNFPLYVFLWSISLKNGNKNQYCDIIQERLFWTRFCSVTRSFCLSYISVFNYTPWYLGLLHILGRPHPPATPTHSIISNRYWWLEKNKEIQPNPPPGDFNLTLVLIFYYYKWKPRELSGAITKFPVKSYVHNIDEK